MVVDASVVVKWFFAEPDHDVARELLEGPDPLSAPDLLLVELANALRRKVMAGQVPVAAVRPIIDIVGDGTAVGLDATPPLVPRALELALSIGHAFPDCVYVASAIERGAPLVTADERLARAVRMSGLDVEVRTLR